MPPHTDPNNAGAWVVLGIFAVIAWYAFTKKVIDVRTNYHGGGWFSQTRSNPRRVLNKNAVGIFLIACVVAVLVAANK